MTSSPLTQRAGVLVAVCDLITQGRIPDATDVLNADYPAVVPPLQPKPISTRRLMQLFHRDGFTDRYSGERLVYPGALIALSILLGPSFPYHRNWKQSETHQAFYELYPTVDHVIPLARGGLNDDSNLVTTSMLRNSTKANWLLEELGWPSERAPIVEGWDGLLGWFEEACTAHEIVRRDKAVQKWRRASMEAG